MPLDLLKWAENGGAPLDVTKHDKNLSDIEIADALNVKSNDARLSDERVSPAESIVNNQFAFIPGKTFKGNAGNTLGPVIDVDLATIKNLLNVVDASDGRLNDARVPLTHSHPQSQITNLVSDLATKAPLTDPQFTDARTPLAHNQSIATILGLQAELDLKAALTDPRFTDARTPTTHTHPQSAITNLVADLAAKAATTDPRFTDARVPLAHTQAISTIDGLQDALDVATGGTGVSTSDPRLSDPRLIKDGNYGDFSVTGGLATISAAITGGAVLTTDPRLSDARTPLAHNQAISTVTGLQTALDGKVATSDARLSDARTPLTHTHAQSQITNLTSDLANRVLTTDSRLSDARVPLAHNQAISTVSGLQAALDAKIDGSDARLTDARTPLAHNQAISTITSLQAALDAKVGTADSRLSDARTPLAHVHPQSEITSLVADLAARVLTTDSRLSDARAVANGNYGAFTVTGGVAAVNAGHISNARMVSMATLTIKGNATGATNAPQDLSVAQVQAMLGAILPSDTRLTNARAIADGNYKDFSVASGLATIDRTLRTLTLIGGYDVSGLAGTTVLEDIDEVPDRILYTNPDGSPGEFDPAQLASWEGAAMAAYLFANDGSKLGEPVRVVDLQAAANLTTAYAAGQTVGGVVMAAGQRFLMAGRSTSSQNGPYTVQPSGAPVRTLDGVTDAKMRGTAYLVLEGTNKGHFFRNTNTSAITVGTTGVAYEDITPAGGGVASVPKSTRPVRVVATVNAPLGSAFAAGQVVGGVTLVLGDPFLIAGQTAGAENGPYTVPASGAPTRDPDGDTDAELRGASYLVLEGYGAGGVFRNTNASAITVGTTALTYAMVTAGGGQGNSVAAAATVVLGSGSQFHITGSGGPIADIDFLFDYVGRTATIVTDGAPTFTNGANLITPNGEDFTATAGDIYTVTSEGSDVIRMGTVKQQRSVLALGNVTGNFPIAIKSYHSGITMRLTGNATINAISGMIDGALMGTIEVFVSQDGTGGRTLSESVSPEITPLGADALALNMAANATTILLLQGTPGGNFFIMNTGRSY